jgi:TonB family protein
VTRWLLTAFLLAAAPPAPPAPAPVPAAPKAPRWIVHWAEQRCSLIREMGGADGASLMVRTVPGTGQAELWVLDPKWQGPQRHALAQFEIEMDPSGADFSQFGYLISFRGQPGIAITNLEPGFIDSFSGSERLRVGAAGKRYGEYRIPASARAVASLRECEAEIMRDWGLDPTVQSALRQRAKPDKTPARWFDDRDYPSEAVRQGQSGSVLARYSVDVNGRVSDCFIVETSGHALLDRQTCAVLLKRGRYEPAVAADGSVTRSMAAIRIHWRLPTG